MNVFREFFGRVMRWLKPAPKTRKASPPAEDEDRSTMATLVKLLQDRDGR